MTTTQTAKHTPGPWKQNGNTVWEDGTKDRGHIAVCRLRVGTHVPEFQNEANARLIAAAPDLLAVLEKVLAAYEAAREPGHGTILIAEARAAIAKARGQA